jgi:type IV secretion system protein VirD4
MRRTPLDGADLALIAGAVAAFLLACLWAAVVVGGALTGAGFAAPRAVDLPVLAVRVVAAPFASASVGNAGPPAWLVSALALFLAAAPALAALTGRGRRYARRIVDGLGGAPRGARWASSGDLEPLVAGADASGRLVIGRAAGRTLATQQQHSVIVFGPTGSFKTSGLAIPAIRDWDGPVLCASVKTDLLRHTIEHRDQRGDIMIFDPTESTGMPSDGWSPLGQCASWPGALRVAQWLCAATHTGGSGGDLDFWYRAAKKLLAPLLFAAAASGRSMADLVRWVDHQTDDEVDAALREAGCDEAIDAWTARELRDPKQRSSIYTTLETVLDAYQDPRVLRDAHRAGITRGKLLNGGKHALYICAPSDDQDALRSVFSTLILSITTAVYEKTTATRQPLDPPLLLVLDELANVAPVPRLDVLASTGRDQGIQQLSILQDFSQLEERYGTRRARTIVNNHHAKLVLSGQSDQATLDLVAQLLGEEEVDQRSRSVADGRTTRTDSTTFRRLAPANAAREQMRGQGILIYGNLPAARVQLRPWFDDEV